MFTLISDISALRGIIRIFRLLSVSRMTVLWGNPFKRLSCAFYYSLISSNWPNVDIRQRLWGDKSEILKTSWNCKTGLCYKIDMRGRPTYQEFDTFMLQGYKEFLGNDKLLSWGWVNKSKANFALESKFRKPAKCSSIILNDNSNQIS